MNTLCLFCNSPLYSLFPCHADCKSLNSCTICQFSYLTHHCTHPNCARASHLYCVQRGFPGKGPSLENFLCSFHMKGELKPKERSKLRLSLQVAQWISIEEKMVAEIKGEGPDSKGANCCTGSVFWFVLGAQFFPSNTSLQFPPVFTRKHFTTTEASIVKSTVSESICELTEKLSFWQSENLVLWETLFFKLNSLKTPEQGEFTQKRTRNCKEHEEIVAEIKNVNLPLLHEKYLDVQLNEDYTFRREKHNELTDDSVCAVCGDNGYDREDIILICSKCDMGVHMNCYGITHLPETDWYCEPCTDVNSLAARQKLFCALCPVAGGALKRTVHQTSSVQSFPNYPSANSPQRVYCHIFCVAHLERAAIKDIDHLTGINLLKVESKRFSMRCFVCGTREGACLQCQHKRCQIAFHPECGKDLFVCIRSKTGCEEVSYYCSLHKPLNLRRVIDAKQRKAADDIVTFCKLADDFERTVDIKLPLKRKKQKLNGTTEFTYEDKFNMFLTAEDYVREITEEPSQGFLLHLKLRPGTKLRTKLEVQQPRKYNLIHPQALVGQCMEYQKQRTGAYYQFYMNNVFPVMKQELKVLGLAPVLYKTKLLDKRIKHDVKTLKKKLKKNPLKTQVVKEMDKQSPELYCICRKPFMTHSAKRTGETEIEYVERVVKNKMVGCDYCEDWYHLSCLGLMSDFNQSDWKCPRCEEIDNQ